MQRLKESLIVKRSVIVRGHKTSVSLEEPFWQGLVAIARRLNMTIGDVIGTIDDGREHANLSSAIRLYVYDFRGVN